MDRCRRWFIELKIRVTAHEEIRLPWISLSELEANYNRFFAHDTYLISWVFRSRLWDDGLSSFEWIITGTCGCVWVYSKSPDPFPHEITRSDLMNTRSSKHDFYISLIWTIFLAFTPTPSYRSSFQNGRHVTELIHRKRAWPDHPFLSKCITIIQ